ncbi:MAG: response regulator [bacterium]|nr:response regulator [bacterium]
MKKVLVVDDARLMRNILRRILEEDLECSVIEACGGEEAVELFKRHSPDAVTMDVTMENGNGIEAARAILAYDREASIVMVTSTGQERMVAEAVRCGVKDFILKPFTRERIRNAVGRVLGIGAPVGWTMAGEYR